MKKIWKIDNMPDLQRKVVIVTGGNSGLGFESVKAFVRKGAKVILACRSVEKGEQARLKILKEVPAAKIETAELDLTDLESVRRFAKAFQKNHSRLDVLLNNAGIMTTPYFQTKDGFEGQIGTNHLGHFALTGLLLGLIRKTPKSRVVNVSSVAHQAGKLNFDNLLFENGTGYSPMKAYGDSKLANLLFTYELQRFFEKNHINSISVAAHPGVSQTDLFRHLDKKWYFRLIYPGFRMISQKSEAGVLPQLLAATDLHVRGGDFYGPGGFMQLKGYPVKVSSNGASRNIENAARLWKISEELTGVRFVAD